MERKPVAGWCCAASSLCRLLRSWEFCVPQRGPVMLLLTEPQKHTGYSSLSCSAQSIEISWAEFAEHNLGEKALLSITGRAQHLLQPCPEVVPSQEIILKIGLTIFNMS